jgi:hypothetical protein
MFEQSLTDSANKIPSSAAVVDALGGIDLEAGLTAITRPDSSTAQTRDIYQRQSDGTVKAVPGIPEYIVGASEGCSTFAAAVATLNVAGTNCTLKVPSGDHTITADLTINSNITLNPLPGCNIIQTAPSLAGNAVNTDTAGTGTLSSTHNTTVVTGSGTSWEVGGGQISGDEYITLTSGALSGTRRKIRRNQSTTILEVFATFDDSIDVDPGTTFTLSSKNVAINSHGLEQGDSVYFSDTGTDRYYVGKVVDSNTITLAIPPSVQFSGGTTWARDFRLNIAGKVIAGPYQWIAEDGPAVRFLSPQKVYPEWWGASTTNAGASGSTTNVKAFNRAIWSGGYGTGTTTLPVPGIAIEVNPGRYLINDSIVMRGGVTLYGVSRAHGSLYNTQGCQIKALNTTMAGHMLVDGYSYPG